MIRVFVRLIWDSRTLLLVLKVFVILQALTFPLVLVKVSFNLLLQFYFKILLGCPTKCKTCSNPEICDSCYDGKFTESGECKNCPQRCKICTSLTNCQSCKPGYGLINNACVLCPAGTILKGQTCERICISSFLH